MKKYLFALIMVLGFSANAAEVSICSGGRCEDRDVLMNYPLVYNSIYNMFNGSVSEDIALCDSDISYKNCEENGLRYMGKVGVAMTDFLIDGANIVSVRKNPNNRNLEVVLNYYMFLNNKRVVCSDALYLLSLTNDGAALQQKGMTCPYNMQSKSKEDHVFIVKLIDLDKRILGLKYHIRASKGVDVDKDGYALLAFTGKLRRPDDFIDADEAALKATEVTNTEIQRRGPEVEGNIRRQAPVSAERTPPFYGNNYDDGKNIYSSPAANPAANKVQVSPGMIPYSQFINGQQGYRGTPAGLNGVGAAPMPAPSNAAGSNIPPAGAVPGEYYKSTLPYPWGYYYPPAEVVIPEADKKVRVKGQEVQKKVEVAPLPKRLLYIQNSGDTSEEGQEEPIIE